ncbi:MAG: sugar kinase [Streptococcaceae bacterium]|jgi:2-dehydro-3-deoxygluconokinase|nr:sugar kinase [Streptococcaceae bacterium]
MGKVLTFGEVLLRLATQKSEFLEDGRALQMNFGGSEANVAVNLAHLGNTATHITVLPENKIGYAAKDFLNRHYVNTDYLQFEEGRMGAYFVETGVGNRASNVVYDRQYSAFSMTKSLKSELCQNCEETEAIFVSGITSALSDKLQDSVMRLIQMGYKKKKLCVYDINYREKLWETREQAFEVTKRYLPFIDVLSAGILDLRVLLNDESIDDLEAGYKRLVEEYPNLKAIFSTTRVTHSTEEYEIVGNLFVNGKLYQTSQQPIHHVVDRIGTGDAFAAGVIHGLLKQDEPQHLIDFAIANMILKHSIYGDVNTFSEEEVEKYLNSQAGVIQR